MDSRFIYQDCTTTVEANIINSPLTWEIDEKTIAFYKDFIKSKAIEEIKQQPFFRGDK